MTVPVQTLSFDADGTLWDFEATMRQALAKTVGFLAGRDERLANLTVDELIVARHQVGLRYRDEVRPMATLRRLAFDEALSRFGCSDPRLLNDVTDFYLTERFVDPLLFDDAVGALDELTERFELVLVSNGNSDPETCGLPGVFSTTLLAEEVGIAKPDPRIYEQLLARIGRAPSEVVHVGDSLVDDVDAARRAGLGTIWINRFGQQISEASHQPDATICSLSELPALMNDWPRSAHPVVPTTASPR